MRVSQMTQSTTQPYVAIMGQIGRPGVFELSGPVPQLAEFLNLAGGTTPNASGSIRLIRGGRSSQFFLSPKLSLQLLPGDLILVESKQFVTGRQNGNVASAPAIVQIGLVNLISRPVILDIPSEQASLAQVLSLLHQPVAGNAEVTVIKPGSGVQNVSVEQAFETALATGVVLVFDPATVNSTVLPRLPNTIRPGDNADSAVTKASAESVAAPATISAPGPASRPESAAETILRVPRQAASDASDQRSPVAIPEKEALPAARKPESIQPASTGAQSPDLPSESPDFQPLPDATDEKSAETEPVAAGAPPANPIWSWLLVAGILACCTVVGFRLRSSFRPQRVKTPALMQLAVEQPVAPSENALELLISGSLPVVEEPLQLPYESEIFGRPRETSPYRTDPAQALSGPHYVLQPSASASPAVAVVAAAYDEQAQEPPRAPVERKVRVDLRHPRSTVSVLDRALATFQGEQP